MLRVVHSNRSAALADALIETIGPRPDPFAPARVVVAGRLLERSLMRQLAERHGIAAGVNWQSFESLLISAYVGEESARAHRLAVLDRVALPQALASVLAELGRAASSGSEGHLGVALDPVRAYLDGGDVLDVARRVQLAERLADLYWSYALSRPQWLTAWEKRAPVAELAQDPAAAWQAELWARMLERVAQGAGRGRRGARLGG
ncbi:MAG TPA: exodeoxyribonuclease V subunit gamma, partial [Kofleriaceae bacterium]|nr:exodeoxyribonuclease V subunit gamma [Kofleriaceae bacterium]